jgi:hypothetical protein
VATVSQRVSQVPKTSRQRSESRQRLAPSNSQTGPFGFSRTGSEEDFKDHHTQDGNNTSLVSTRTHIQPEEKDLEDEGAEAEERNNR